MRKISLISEQGQDKVTIEFNDNGIYDTIRKLEQFLRAVGYKIDGQLIINGGVAEAKGAKPMQQQYTMTGTSATYASQSNPEITTISLTAKDKKMVGEWQDYKFDASSLNQYPTMAPLTTADLRALTSADIAAFTPTSWPYPT